MKRRSYGLVTISLLILLGSCFTAAATSISDGTNDIWHWTNTGTTWSWVGNIGNKPNIDIKEISYEVNGDKITLKMEVEGNIQTSDKVIYWVWFNSTDSSYWLSFTNGNGTGFGMKKTGMNFTSSQNVIISEDTMSVVLDALGDTSNVDLWGYAAEYTTVGDTTSEWWGDWVPNDKFGYDTGDDGTVDTNGTVDGTDDGSDTGGSDSGTSTPGFELIFAVAAVAVALILLRKRR